MADFDFGRAYLTGVSIRRQQEETRALILDRAQKEQAAAELAKLQQAINDARMQATLKSEAAQPIMDRMKAGEPITIEEGRILANAAAAVVMEEFETVSPMIGEALGRFGSNPHFVPAATAMMESLASRTDQRLKINEAIMNGLAEDAKTGAYVTAQSAAAFASTVSAQEMRSQGRREQEKFDIEKPYIGPQAAANVARTEQETESARGQADYYRQEREQSAEMFPSELSSSRSKAYADQVAASRARRIEYRDAAADAISQVKQFGEFVAWADSTGMPEEKIASYLPPDITPGMLRTANQNLDQDVQAELDDLKRRRDTLASDIKFDRVGDPEKARETLSMLNDEMYQLSRMEDAKANASLRWNRLAEDEGMLGTALEKMKLVAQRRKLGLLVSTLSGPVGTFSYIYNADPAELIAEDPDWKSVFGYKGGDGIAAPSEVPTPKQEVREGARRVR